MISERSLILAIDWGEKTIGLAIGQTPFGIRPLRPLAVSRQVFTELASIIQREKAEVIVIGAQADHRFINHLKKQTRKPIKLVNEELTSVAVSQEYGSSKISPHSLAACLILEQYLLNQEQSN